MYVTITDLYTQFGNEEVLFLCSDENGVLDTERLSLVIEQAQSEIDSYLAIRYRVPIQVVPDIVKCIACDIIRYRLTAAEALTTERIMKRYEQAIVWLTGVSQGRIALPLESVNPDEEGVIIDSGTRVWWPHGGTCPQQDTVCSHK